MAARMRMNTAAMSKRLRQRERRFRRGSVTEVAGGPGVASVMRGTGTLWQQSESNWKRDNGAREAGFVYEPPAGLLGHAGPAGRRAQCGLHPAVRARPHR